MASNDKPNTSSIFRFIPWTKFNPTNLSFAKLVFTHNNFIIYRHDFVLGFGKRYHTTLASSDGKNESQSGERALGPRRPRLPSQEAAAAGATNFGVSGV